MRKKGVRGAPWHPLEPASIDASKKAAATAAHQHNPHSCILRQAAAAKGSSEVGLSSYSPPWIRSKFGVCARVCHTCSMARLPTHTLLSSFPARSTPAQEKRAPAQVPLCITLTFSVLTRVPSPPPFLLSTFPLSALLSSLSLSSSLLCTHLHRQLAPGCMQLLQSIDEATSTLESDANEGVMSAIAQFVTSANGAPPLPLPLPSLPSSLLPFLPCLSLPSLSSPSPSLHLSLPPSLPPYISSSSPLPSPLPLSSPLPLALRLLLPLNP